MHFIQDFGDNDEVVVTIDTTEFEFEDQEPVGLIGDNAEEIYPSFDIRKVAMAKELDTLFLTGLASLSERDKAKQEADREIREFNNWQHPKIEKMKMPEAKGW